MRVIITLITSLILLIPASGQGQWKIVDDEIDSIQVGNKRIPLTRLYDVHFVDRDIGFFSGCHDVMHYSFGQLFKTEDGGKTWNLIAEDFGLCVLSLYYSYGSKGFAETTYDGLFTSTDGGHSWTKDTTIDSDYVTNIFFLNDSIGWAAGGRHEESGTTLYKTINVGEDWSIDRKRTIRENIYSVFFIDEESGWAVGNNGLIIKYSLNDGWETLPVVTDLPLGKVFFVDRENGWISGGYENFDNGSALIFMRTVDGGENWTKTEGLNYLINDFHFENIFHGWAIGEFGANDMYEEARGVILETFDSGLEWKVVTDTLSGRLNALHFKDGIGWAVGDNGLILKYESAATEIKEDNNTTNSKEPLFQNYPNPFQSSTTISYQLPATSDVELSIYDISGRKVATLVNGTREEDSYEVEWNTEGIAAGIYFCELKGRHERQVIKMIIVGQ